MFIVRFLGQLTTLSAAYIW